MKLPKGELGMPMAAAVALLLLGAGLIIWPEAVIGVFPPLLGAVLLLVGTLNIAHAMVLSRRKTDPGFKFVQGVVNVIVGLVFIAKQDVSLAFLTILFGLYVLVSASVNFSSAIKDKSAGKTWVATLVESFFEMLLGLILLFGPFSGRALWIRVLGLYFVVAAGHIFGVLASLKRSLKNKQQSQQDADEDNT